MDVPLKFNCYHCRTVLSVPRAFAGVSAPCPRCGETITAPASESINEKLIADISPSVTSTTISDAHVRQVNTDALEKSSFVQNNQLALDRGVNPATSVSHGMQSGATTVETDDFTESLAAVVKPARSKIWLRVAIPMVVLSLIGLSLYGLMKVMKGSRPTVEPVTIRKSIPLAVPVGEPTVQAIKETNDDHNTSSKSTGQQDIPQLPKPAFAINAVEADNVVATTGVKHAVAPDNGAIEVAKLVDQFLSATTFMERKNIISTKKPIIELEQSILAKPFPSYDVNAGAQIPISDENITEFYYEIRFYKNDIGLPTLCTLLIQKRGTEPAKIIIDPFLDIVDGRLAKFAKHSQDGLLDFYVIMDPRVKCFDDNVPNAFKKSTFYLRAHSNGEDIATAYATEVSSVRQLFNDPTSGLKWKLPIPVVVTLQWNKNEDKQRPFLELVNIKALNWSSNK